MRVIKEWYGAYNSTLYLQDYCFDDGKKHLTILYAHSQVGYKYESGKNYFPEDLNNEKSELVTLIRSDFDDACYAEMKQTVQDYFEGKEINRW